MAVQNIASVEVKGHFNEWGIKANEYNFSIGTSSFSTLDYPTLVTKVNLKRAGAQEQEIVSLSTKMRNRNKAISELGSLLADLGALAKKYKNDKGSEEQSLGFSPEALEGLKLISTSWKNIYDGEGDDKKYKGIEITINKYTKNFYSGSDTSVFNYDYEFLNQRTKSLVDQLNNETQNDMNRLQSIVTKRDESYSTATSLLKNSRDTIGTVIKNI